MLQEIYLKYAVTKTRVIFCLLVVIPQTISLAQVRKPGRACYAVSIPKSGTGLLSKLLRALSYKLPKIGGEKNSFPMMNDGEFLIAHADASSANIEMVKKGKCKVIAIIRDPRDVVVSMYYYFGKGYAEQLGIPFEDKNTLLGNIIKYWHNAGFPKSRGKLMCEYYDSFLNWSQYEDAYITTFEKLVGVQGNGFESAQKEDIRRIANFLEISLSDGELENVIAHLFGGSSTFRNGKIGSWKDEFTLEHVALFKEVSQDLLFKLGYENNNNWNI